jgi:HEAT repeat protein
VLNRHAIPILLELLREEQDEGIRRQLIAALDEFEEEEVWPQILPLLRTDPARRADVEAHFSTAVRERGTAYIQARDALIAMGEAALPFLRESRQDHDWRAWMVAEVALERIVRPELYRYERGGPVPVPTITGRLKIVGGFPGKPGTGV